MISKLLIFYYETWWIQIIECYLSVNRDQFSTWLQKHFIMIVRRYISFTSSLLI